MLSFYMVDTKNFVELFCVNQDKPDLECDGKCELSKLAESNPSNEKPSYLDFLQKEVILYWTETPSVKSKVFKQYSFIDSEYLNNYHFVFNLSSM